MRRGEVRWYTFKYPDKRRPVVILTRDAVINYMHNLTIAPVTTTIRHTPSEVTLTQEDGLPRLSVVNLDNIQTMPKAKIGGLITVLSPKKMKEVESALCFALGVDWR